MQKVKEILFNENAKGTETGLILVLENWKKMSQHTTDYIIPFSEIK